MGKMMKGLLTSLIGNAIGSKVNQNGQGLIEAAMKGMNSTKNIPQPVIVGDK